MMIAHYPFIEDASDTVYDGQSGDSDGPFDGVFVNAPAVRRQGKVGSTALFADASAMSSPSAWVSCPKMAGLTSIAISAWVYIPDSGTPSASVTAKTFQGSSATIGVSVSLSSSTFAVSGPGFGSVCEYGSYPSGWHQIAVCYSSKGLVGYLDGERILKASSGYDSSQGFGNGYFAFSYGVGSAIQDIRIYDSPISKCEAESLCEAQVLYLPLCDDELTGDCSDFGRSVSDTDVSIDAASPIRGTSSARFSSGSFILASSVPSLAEFAVSAWISIDSVASAGNRLVFDQGGLVSLFVDEDGKPGASLFGTDLLSPSAIDVGWHHITVTGKEGEAKLYVDGVQLNSSTTLAISWPSDAPSEAYIGSDHTGESGFFVGRICDVRMYGTCLSASAVASVFRELGTIDSEGNATAYGLTEGSVDPESWTDSGTALTCSYVLIRQNHRYSWNPAMKIREFSIEAGHAEVQNTDLANNEYLNVTPTADFLMTLTYTYPSGTTAEDKESFTENFVIIDETEGYCDAPEVMNSAGTMKAGALDESEEVTGVEVYSDKVKANSFSEE